MNNLERNLFAPEYNDEKPSLPKAFAPYLDQKFILDWFEGGVACFSAAHPRKQNLTFLECTFDQDFRLSVDVLYRKNGFSFDELARFKNAEFKTKSLIPGDKNLQRAYWSNAV